MRFLLILFLALAAGIGLTVLAENPGYVLISREPWSLETSLTMLAFGLLLSFIIFYLLFRLLDHLLSTPAKVRHWQKQRNRDQAIEDTRKGLLEAISGNWGQAEKLLAKRLEISPQPELNLLTAAWISQQQDKQQKRDDYIAEASKVNLSSTDDGEMAIGLIQCHLQEQAGQTEQALATARMLYQQSPANPVVIRSLVKHLKETRQWQELLSVLAVASRHHVLTENKLLSLQILAATELLASTKDISDVAQKWKILSKNIRKQTAVIASYCRRLLQLDRHEEAETLLRNTLKQQWSEELVEIYGLVRTGDPGSQIKHAESWLTEHPTNTQLMLCMGRLAIQNQLWGMARSFLEVAVQNGDSSQAFLELAWLLESLDESDAALQTYRLGLENSLSSGPQDFTIPPHSRLDLHSGEQEAAEPAFEQNHEPGLEQEVHPPSLAYSNESK